MQLSQILTTLLENQNISAYKFSKDTGISDRLVGYWKKGDKLPSAENLIIIANYFSISVDYLLGRTENPTGLSEDYSADELKLINDYRELSEQGKAYILDTMDMVKEKYKKNRVYINRWNR